MVWGERGGNGHLGGDIIERSLVKLIPLSLGRAQRLDRMVAVTHQGPEQAVWPCAQFTPRGRCSPVAEEFSPFVPDTAPRGFGLTEQSNDLKPWHAFPISWCWDCAVCVWSGCRTPKHSQSPFQINVMEIYVFTVPAKQHLITQSPFPLVCFFK